MTRPLRSARITGPRRYYEAVRPCAPHRYSAPRGFRRLGISLPRTATGQHCATGRPRARDDRFPRSTPKPGPSSRHLHAGHHLASQQAPARLIPDPHAAPGFDVTHIVSTRHQWIAHARLLGPHLTRSKRAFSATLSTPALNRRTSRWFAASPCRTTAEAHPPSRPAPPSPMQHRTVNPAFYNQTSSCVRGTHVRTYFGSVSPASRPVGSTFRVSLCPSVQGAGVIQVARRRTSLLRAPLERRAAPTRGRAAAGQRSAFPRRANCRRGASRRAPRPGR
jgi:hypothetical protein